MSLITLCILMASGVGAGIIKPSITEPQTCQCVSKRMCMDNESGANIKDLVDIRLSYSKCENPEDVCCKAVKRVAVHKVLLETESEENTSNDIQELPESAYINTCGYQAKLSRRIIGGGMVTTGELPWTVAILFKDEDNWKFLCGGSIIHPQVVLTAGHCVYKYEVQDLRVRAGEIDNESESEPLPHQDSFVNDMVIHQNFHPETLKNDIALLFLIQPFILSANVQIACLPSGDLSAIQPNCESGGYGVVGLGAPFTGKQLNKVSIPLVKKRECVHKLRSTRLGGHFNLHRSFICAGGGDGQDTCKGDGGSALVCPMKNQENRYIQVGIVSWGIGCGGGTPGIYTNVNLFRGWIDEHLIEKNMDINVNVYH